MTQSYPQTFDCEFDFLSYINDGIELKEGNYSWTLDIEKQYNTEEQYLEWLYFRRRQGFGKNKWK